MLSNVRPTRRPGSPLRILLVSLFDEWCLGLRSLSAVLRADGHTVFLAWLRSMAEMHDAAGEGDPEGYHTPPGSVAGRDFRALADLARRLDPDLVGLSLTSNYYGLAVKTTALLREALGVPGVPVVWGGIDPTANPDLAIEAADIVCLGEGEGAATDLARALAAGQPIDHIPNLWVRSNGGIQRNDVRSLIANLDRLPFPDFEPRGKFYVHGGEAREGAPPAVSHLNTSYPTICSRGCPFSCTYCCNSMLRDLYGAKGYIRRHSVGYALGEIRRHLASNPQINFIEFHDDVFGIQLPWLREFAEDYPGRVGLPFFAYTEPSLCTPERVALLKKAGMAYTILGVQSGSPRTLREIYQRNASPKRILQAVRLLRQEGIVTIIDLIGRNPLETEDDCRETLELLLAFPPGFIVNEIMPLSIYRHYPIAGRIEPLLGPNPWIPGRNTALAPDNPVRRFWDALFTLTQFDSVGRDALRALAGDPFLREHPEALESIAEALVGAVYLNGTRLPVSVVHEQVESELNRLRGSRAVRWALRLRQFLGRDAGGRPKQESSAGRRQFLKRSRPA
ncbi:MAG: radical SAM protein [Candidatus Sumerlaeota bacterium]|nr:radical SAM protein [Candidatus Sumerlaeota bacterium]